MTRLGRTSRSVLFILMISLVCPMSLVGQEATAKMTKEQFDKTIATYYQKPSPGLIPAAMNYMSEAGIPKDNAQVAPFLGFFAVIFRDNPQRLLQWQSQFERFKGNTRKLMQEALVYSQSPERLTGKDKETLLPDQNDLCWGAYFASGDEAYLEKITERIQYLGERTKFMTYVTAATAQWSLASNARQHKSVKAFLEKKVTATTGPIHKAIQEILEKDPVYFREEMTRIVKEGQENKTWVMPEQQAADAKK